MTEWNVSCMPRRVVQRNISKQQQATSSASDKRVLLLLLWVITLVGAIAGRYNVSVPTLCDLTDLIATILDDMYIYVYRTAKRVRHAETIFDESFRWKPSIKAFSQGDVASTRSSPAIARKSAVPWRCHITQKDVSSLSLSLNPRFYTKG